MARHYGYDWHRDYKRYDYFDTGWAWQRLRPFRGGGFNIFYKGERVGWLKHYGSVHGLLHIMKHEKPDVDWSDYARPG
jgi:hypothetical protein